MLKAGDKAPEFSLQNQNGETVSSKDFAGKRYVVYFYPRDNTSGCTRQACAFAANYEKYQQLDVPVIGISKDSVASHKKFEQKHELPFILLSDPELQAIQGYDVWQEKKLYGKVSMGVVRSAFLVGKDGNIEQAWHKVKPDDNATLVLDWMEENK